MEQPTLVLFDVDGTLTATNKVDAECYAAAFGRVFGFALPTTDWAAYAHVTDSGIIHETLEHAWGRPASADELAAFESAFVEALQEAHARCPDGFREIPGAAAILESIGARSDMAAGIASGGMRGSAYFKLACAGIRADALPGGFANDAVTRHGIVRCAITRCAAGRPAGGSGVPAAFHDIVYVGDGPWDVRTSADLGMRFVGVTGDGQRARLHALGVAVCVEDYRNADAFFAALEAASSPRLPS